MINAKQNNVAVCPTVKLRYGRMRTRTQHPTKRRLSSFEPIVIISNYNVFLQTGSLNSVSMKSDVFEDLTTLKDSRNNACEIRFSL